MLLIEEDLVAHLNSHAMLASPIVIETLTVQKALNAIKPNGEKLSLELRQEA